MLENERIIVQDRGGIDAGIAALMQNANKGFDPAALMAMMNNGNGMFGGNGGWWWIFIIVLFWMWGGWGGNGFGRGNQAETNSDFARLAAMGNQNNNTDLLMQAINGNKDAINTFSQLTSGTRIHVLEITGTFKKNTTYSLGTVVSVSKPYDEPVPPTQFPMPMQNRRKLVDLVISCDGEQRKLSVSEDKTMMTDSSIGLTIATEKSQIVNMVRQSLDDCRIKKESLSKIDEEMRRCEDILKILNVNSDITTNVTKDFKELDDLKAEVKELKQLLQNVSAVRPEVIKNTPPNSTEDKKVEPEGEIKKEI